MTLRLPRSSPCRRTSAGTAWSRVRRPSERSTPIRPIRSPSSSSTASRVSSTPPRCARCGEVTFRDNPSQTRQDRWVFDQRQRRLLLLLAIACFTEGYDFNALMVALPHLRHDFGLSRAAADLWVAAVYLGAAPALWLGRRADRHGRRGVLVLAVAGYTVCSAATALAPDMGIFVLTQFFARTFMAVQVAVAWTVAAEELPAERRGFGFGILALASALGTGLGAVLEAPVLAPPGASWRWLYVASLPVVIVILVLRRELPESKRYEHLV